MTIENLRQNPHLSASSLSTYQDCGLLYRLSRIDKHPVEGKSDAMEFGKAIHQAVADFNIARMHDRASSELREALE